VLLGIAVALVLAGLVAWLLVRRRNQRRAWLQRADRLVRDTDALADLAAAGATAPDPQAQVAHWSAVEQRAAELTNQIDTVLPTAPDDASRSALTTLSAATNDYLTAVRTTRQLHIGPPAPTQEQLDFAAADANQRLVQVRNAVEPLRQVVAAEPPPT
jgi:hypothetical protein